MIDTEAQKAAALSWIAYWKRGRAAGDQSWLANEQALGEIMLLQAKIVAYDQRLLTREVDDHAAEKGSSSC